MEDNKMKNLKWISAIVLAIGITTSAKSSEIDCLKTAIKYVDHPVIQKSQIDTLLAGFRTDEVKELISEEEINNITEGLNARLNYELVNALCTIYSVEQMQFMYDMLENSIYLSILENQHKVFEITIKNLKPDMLEVEEKIFELLMAKNDY